MGLALWNGRDPILKERMFGLTNSEGNHGEDVKELWWYLDGTPTHSYMRMLYKYPQARFPYDELVAENGRRRGQNLPEFELADTGVFDDGRYFDVTVEYAKAAPRDILMRVTVVNHGPETAELHVLPQLWARNTWSWKDSGVRPQLRLDAAGAVQATRTGAIAMRFSALQEARFLFCENDTNPRRLFGMAADGFFKDAINDWLVAGDATAVNPDSVGTKCAAHQRLKLGAGKTSVLRFRFAPADGAAMVASAFDRGSPPGLPRPISSTPPFSAAWPTPTRGRSSGRRSQACYGPSSISTSTYAVGCGATRRSPRHQPGGDTGATATGST